ncbi:hypothetical protein ACH5RR_015266 [Cinchona calisaya]|uniref:Uncharacterized protein n=1 Tax=Cinchona calisaya TaxID=153742 RepID=A0ABD2ZSM9_9GENT
MVVSSNIGRSKGVQAACVGDEQHELSKLTTSDFSSVSDGDMVASSAMGLLDFGSKTKINSSTRDHQGENVAAALHYSEIILAIPAAVRNAKRKTEIAQEISLAIDESNVVEKGRCFVDECSCL